jgi:hypothetical protein
MWNVFICLTIGLKEEFYEHSQENQAAIKGGEFIEYVTNSHVLKKDSAPLR